MTNSTQIPRAASADGPAVAVPRTDSERVLQDIWSAVLKVERLGRHDDFLGLGGDSLAAMRCNNRVRERFGIELPLELYFLEPADIAALAGHLDRMLQHER